jgi:hypothetical protein
LAVQSPHVPPLLPQTIVAVPVWQLPPIVAEQQPPLHGRLESHAEPQVCVATSHA